jgi:ketosteroid isomerase-like protein
MKNGFLLIAIIVLVASGCQQPEKEKINVEKEKDAIRLVLQKYALANENQDIGMIGDIWCPSERIVSFGTESGEKLVGWEQIKAAVIRQFSSFSNTYIFADNQIIEVNATGNTAWFSEIINYNFIRDGKANSYEGLRYTGVLVKKDGKWLLVQTHMSVPEVRK